jgi:hypothetical protein
MTRNFSACNAVSQNQLRYRVPPPPYSTFCYFKYYQRGENCLRVVGTSVSNMVPHKWEAPAARCKVAHLHHIGIIRECNRLLNKTIKITRKQNQIPYISYNVGLRINLFIN